MPQPFAYPQYAPPPAPRPAPPRPTVAAPAPTPAPAPRPVARGNVEPAPPPPLPPLRLPKPSALGIVAAAAPAAVDWAEVRGRLEGVGAVGFAFEKTAAGLFRVTCLMPTAVPDAPHRIWSEAESEVEAVRLTFSRVDDWLRGK